MPSVSPRFVLRPLDAAGYWRVNDSGVSEVTQHFALQRL
jgi:hypothetical protein